MKTNYENKLDHESICTFCDNDRDECGEMWCFKASRLKEVLVKIYDAWWGTGDCDTCKKYLTDDCGKDDCEGKEQSR